MAGLLNRFMEKWTDEGGLTTAWKALRYPFRRAYGAVARIPYRRSYRRMLALETRRQRFEEIYDRQLWKSGESLSGGGSELNHTQQVRDNLPRLVRKFEIARIVDAGCGDFNWLRHIRSELDAEYLGLDIVPSVIAANRKAFAGPRTEFEVADIIEDALPDADLLIARDVIFHLSYRDIDRLLANFARSHYRYLLTTSHVVSDKHTNVDIVTGDFRKIDLFKAPFNFPSEVIQSFDDHPHGQLYT